MEPGNPDGGDFTNLLFHIVFSTKDSAALITAEIQQELFNYIGGIVRAEGGVLLEVGAMEDHVHLLVKIRGPGGGRDGEVDQGQFIEMGQREAGPHGTV